MPLKQSKACKYLVHGTTRLNTISISIIMLISNCFNIDYLKWSIILLKSHFVDFKNYFVWYSKWIVDIYIHYIINTQYIVQELINNNSNDIWLSVK